VGLLDKLKEKTRGIVGSVKPEAGAPVLGEAGVRARLHAISGRGVGVRDDGEDVAVSWSAKVASVGIGGGGYEYRYRALRVTLNPAKHTAAGICFKTSTDAELTAEGLSVAKGWERGQHVGSEKLRVLAWLGPHYVKGGAGEEGYEFRWSDLRDPVIDAVTGAGWTYKAELA